MFFLWYTGIGVVLGLVLYFSLKYLANGRWSYRLQQKSIKYSAIVGFCWLGIIIVAMILALLYITSKMRKRF